MNADDRYKKALAFMESRTELDGVASIRFEDGQMFMFSVDKLLELTEAALKGGTGTAIVYVKTGKSVDDPEHNQ